MLCIANSAYVESADRQSSSPDAWLKDGPAMEKLFEDLPEALTNTAVIAQRCAVAAPSGDRSSRGSARTRTSSFAPMRMPASRGNVR